MINSSVNTDTGPEHPALLNDGTGSGRAIGKRFGRTLSFLPTASEAENYLRIPDATDSNMMGETDSSNTDSSNTVSGKSLEKRTLSVLNQLAAGASAMAGSAWVRGASFYHPANLAISLIQQAPGLVGTACPDCPGLICAARSVADWGQAYGWANSIYAAMATGNIPAVATTAALCGASYACHNFSSNSVKQLCARCPAALQDYGEPWLQAVTRVAVASALRVAETVGTSETVNKEGRRFNVPAQDTTGPATEEPTPSVTVNRWDSPGTPLSALGTNATENALHSCSENIVSADFSSLPILSAQAEPTAQTPTNKSPSAKSVILPANHTGHGQASLMSTDSLNNDALNNLNNNLINNVVQPENLADKSALGSFLQFPLAEAGVIRSFTREQQKGLLQAAAHQHLMLAQQCPDMASATPVDNNGTVYRAESDASGWVTIAHNQSFHYQLFSTDPVSPLTANLADGNQIPAPGILHLAHSILDRITVHNHVETLPPMADLAKNVTADKRPQASAHLSFAQPKVQNQLDPGVLSTEVKNGTVLILKPCNFVTGQPEAPVLVLSTDQQALNVETHIGTDGFVAESSLRARREAPPANPIRLAPECQTTEPGYINGRLEVFANGQWGTVCDDYFGTSEARVACAQLGFTGGVEIETKTKICPPLWDQPIHLYNVRCNGDESNLQDCSHPGLGIHYCGHEEDMVLRCQLFQLSTNGCESEPGSVIGRLRVWQNGTWGSVCDQGMGDGDSICKSMGFAGGVSKPIGSCPFNPHRTDPILWAGLRCNGTEAGPHGCSHHELTNNCSHDHDVVLSCKPGARLSPDCQTQKPGFVSGRLEVFGRGQWGTVCANNFDTRDAIVACAQLGYPGAIASYTSLGQSCPADDSPILLNYLGCTGNETSLQYCDHRGLGINYCQHHQNVQIHCQLFQLSINVSTNGCHSEPGSVIGKLRVWQNGTWGTVCDKDMGDGDNICKSIGFYGGSVMQGSRSCPSMTNQTGPIFWSGLRCNGTEPTPHSCSHHELTSNCSHKNDLVLNCKTTARLSPNDQIKEPGLVSGRLEVFGNSQWGTVCYDHFAAREASVACAQLGYPGALATSTAVGSSRAVADGPILLDNLACTGNETSLQDCNHPKLGMYNCGHDKDVVLSCQFFQLSSNGCKSEPGSVIGWLLVWQNGTWGSVCDQDIGDGNSICQSIGFPGGVVIKDSRSCPTDSVQNHPIHWAGLRCNGTEASPHECLHHDLTNNCSHKNDVLLSCNTSARISPYCQTKEPGFFSGRLEVFGNGQWGTVCDDNFDTGDARVACAQLGYPGAIAISTVASSSCAAVDSPILLDNLGCTGSETSLQDCDHRGLGVHNCQHNKHVHLRCQLFQLSTQGCHAEPGSVIGILRVWQNGTWGSVCNQQIGHGNGICKSMGFTGGAIKDMGACPASNTDPTDPIHWAGLRCNGTEARPHDCWHHELTNHCSHENDLVLSCNATARFSPDCWTKKPGFVGGRLEVFVNGQWGTVCDDDFDTQDARVACTQLGYPGAIANFTGVARSCPPARSILLNNLRCNGDETSLQDCDHGGLGIHHCRHYEDDVAVRCLIPPPARSTKNQKMRKNIAVIGFAVGCCAVSCALHEVCRNTRKLRQENDDLSTCQLIGTAVVITIMKPFNLCLRRSALPQPPANDVPASAGHPLHHQALHQNMPPPTYDESNALYIPPPSYNELTALYIPPPTYDESNTFPYVLQPSYNEPSALDVESMEMATISTLD